MLSTSLSLAVVVVVSAVVVVVGCSPMSVVLY